MTETKGLEILRIFGGDRRRYAIILLVIILCALSMRIGRCFVTDKLNPDSILYIEIAKNWVYDGFEAAFAAGHRIPPLYPGLMALGEWVGIGAEQAGRTISILAGTATVLAAFVMVRLVLRSMPLVLFATALAAVHPYLVRISENVLRDSLFICLEAWALAFAMLGARTRRLGWWIAAGVATFLSEATRTEGLEIVPILAVWCCWELWRGRTDLLATAKKILPGPVLATFISFVFLAPVQMIFQRLTSSKWGMLFMQFLQYQELLSVSKTAAVHASPQSPSPGGSMLRMAPIFSFDFLSSLAGAIATTIFPTNIAMAVMAVFNRNAFRRGAALNLLLVAITVMIVSRITLIIAGMPDSRRYFLVLAFLLTIPAAPGLLAIVDLCKRLFPSLQRHAFSFQTVLAAIVLAVCMGKALNPNFGKAWLRESATFIKACSSGASEVFVFSDMDARIAYYAGAKNVIIRLEDVADPLARLEERITKYRKPGVRMFIIPDSSENFDRLLSAAGGTLSVRKIKELPKKGGGFQAIYEAE